MFCRYCGAELPNESSFCSKCGKETGLESASNNSTFNVSIFRPSQIYLINPPINIKIDDKMQTSIENGGNVVLKLNPGNHRILFYQSMRKREITFQLTRDIHVVVKWNRITGCIEAEIS